MITGKTESVKISSKTMNKVRKFIKNTPYTLGGYVSQAVELILAMDIQSKEQSKQPQ